MFRFVFLLSCIAVCRSHAVLPLVVPAAHSVHVPLVAPYSYGYGHGLLGHGFLAKPLGHHILKRSPHVVAPFAHGHVGHVVPLAPIAQIAPVAVSHQSRLDVHSAPVIAPVPVVKQIITPVVAAPLLHKPLLGGYGLGYGAGQGGYAGGLGHYGYGAHLGHY